MKDALSGVDRESFVVSTASSVTGSVAMSGQVADSACSSALRKHVLPRFSNPRTIDLRSRARPQC